MLRSIGAFSASAAGALKEIFKSLKVKPNMFGIRSLMRLLTKSIKPATVRQAKKNGGSETLPKRNQNCRMVNSVYEFVASERNRSEDLSLSCFGVGLYSSRIWRDSTVRCANDEANSLQTESMNSDFA